MQDKPVLRQKRETAVVVSDMGLEELDTNFHAFGQFDQL
jgi:hypothetical protein